MLNLNPLSYRKKGYSESGLQNKASYSWKQKGPTIQENAPNWTNHIALSQIVQNIKFNEYKLEYNALSFSVWLSCHCSLDSVS